MVQLSPRRKSKKMCKSRRKSRKSYKSRRKSTQKKFHKTNNFVKKSRMHRQTFAEAQLAAKLQADKDRKDLLLQVKDKQISIKDAEYILEAINFQEEEGWKVDFVQAREADLKALEDKLAAVNINPFAIGQLGRALDSPSPRRKTPSRGKRKKPSRGVKKPTRR